MITKPVATIVLGVMAVQCTHLIAATILALNNQPIWAGVMVALALLYSVTWPDELPRAVQESEARP